MNDLSNLSDEQLTALYQGSAAPTSNTARPLSQWSDEELQAAYGQPQANALTDVAKQIGSGLVTGIENIPAAPAMLANLGGRAVEAIAPQGMISPEAQQQQDTLRRLIAANRGEGIANYLPQPQTTAGEYARTGASFVPSMLGLGGNLVRNAAIGGLSGLGSEAGGQAFKGTQDEALARAIGALGAGSIGLKTTAGSAARAGVTIEDLKSAARPVFEETTALGNTIAVPGEDIAKNVGAGLHEAALRQANAPRTYRELTRLSGAEDLNDVAIARDKMRDIANGIAENRLIKVGGPDSQAARRAMTALDAEIEQLSPGWVAKMQEADANWAAARRAETVMKEADKNRLGSFGNNEGRVKGFTPAEIAAARRANQGGPFGAALGAVGSVLNPFHGGKLEGAIRAATHTGAAIGTGGASIVPSLAGIPVGMAADVAAGALRRRALDQATQKILSRSPLAQQLQAEMEPLVQGSNNAALLAALLARQPSLQRTPEGLPYYQAQ